MGRSRFKFYEDQFPYFISSSIVNGITLFNDFELTKIILSSLHFIQENFRVTVYAYVIMPNHIHLILKSENLPDYIRRFKSFTAKEIIRKLKQMNEYEILNELRRAKLKHKRQSQFQVWNEGVHPMQIYNYWFMEQKLNYIHQNPVKAGLVNKPEDWEFSSARNYIRGRGTITITIVDDIL